MAQNQVEIHFFERADSAPDHRLFDGHVAGPLAVSPRAALGSTEAIQWATDVERLAYAVGHETVRVYENFGGEK